MGSSLILCLLLSAVLPRAGAQDENPALAIARALEARLLPEVSSRLKSERLPTITWGAYLAGKWRVKSAAPLLRSRLKALQEYDRLERRFAVLAILDALLRCDARIPLVELEPYLRGTSYAPAFILASREPSENRAYFVDQYRALDTQGRRTHWLACGNLLASTKAKGLCRNLLDAFVFEVKVTVTDPGSQGLGRGMGGRIGGRFGSGRLDVPKGYPPIVLYNLTDDGLPGDRLFASGSIPIYYQRRQYNQRKIGFGSNDRMRLSARPGIRRAWLAQILGTGSEYLRLPFEKPLAITWTNAAAYSSAILSERYAIEKNFDDLVKRCVKQKVLSAEESKGLAAQVGIRVYDDRVDKSVELPKIPSK